MYPVHHDASFELSKSTIGKCSQILTIRGALLIKRGSKRYAEWKNWSKMVSKVFFLELMAFPMDINVRPKIILRISI